MRSGVLVLLVLATMCYVETNILVTPSQLGSADSLQGVAITIAESLATQHGLREYVLNRGCNVEGAAGRLRSEWRAGGGPAFSICAELRQPWRLKLHLQDAAFSRSSREEALERELVTVLRTRLGEEAVRVSH